MSLSEPEPQTRVCPKTGSILEPKRMRPWARVLLAFAGLGALIWFLIRVVPKPARATYPCQRVAFPLASGFVIWLLGLGGSATLFRKAGRSLQRARYGVAAICLAAGVGLIWTSLSATSQKASSAAQSAAPVPNQPIGEGKGVHPGRVAWIHDANATDWAGPGSGERWYSNTCTDQQVVNQMLSKALHALTGKASDHAAWEAIFRSFNTEHGRGDVGYTPGERIGIKINGTLMYSNPSSLEKPSNLVDRTDNSPQLTIALLKQLTDVAGVRPGDISIGDPGRAMANYWYNMVEANCPGVVYLSRTVKANSGRTVPAPDPCAPFYWSDPVASHWANVTKPDYVPTHFSQADYFINFPILKSHNDGGITLCGKNLYGALIRNPADSGYFNMHLSRPTESPGMGHHRANVDLMAHPRLGGKTLLALIDGLYAGISWDSRPIKWRMSPFNDDWPSSIILSQDQVAADSVGFDFLYTEWADYPHKSGAEDYLHEAALAANPPSGVTYDPNHDGGLTRSLGAHEHWSDAADKLYSRNLGAGTGIELVTSAPGWPDLNGDWWVDGADFVVLARAWRTMAGEDGWNPACDVSMPADGTIDARDLAVLSDNWLTDLAAGRVAPGAKLQQVYSASKYFESPTWDPATGRLYVTNRTDKQILRIDGPGIATVWMANAPGTNGTFLSIDGRMLTADEDTRQIRSLRIGASGPEDARALAGPLQGIKTKPNDLCQLDNGNVYFTAPDWSLGPNDQGVYLLRPDGSVLSVKTGLYQPNGIIASIDGSMLYVSESSSNNVSKKRWWVFSINPDGSLGAGSVFFKPANPPTHNDPDGMTMDEHGNLYFCGMGGVWIVSPEGVQLDMIRVPEFCSNVAFGGASRRTLYLTCQNKVYSLAMLVRGHYRSPAR